MVDSILASKKTDLTILRKIKGLFETCDMARFAFSRVDDMKMQDDMKELKEIVGYLEKRKI